MCNTKRFASEVQQQIAYIPSYGWFTIKIHISLLKNDKKVIARLTCSHGKISRDDVY